MCQLDSANDDIIRAYYELACDESRSLALFHEYSTIYSNPEIKKMAKMAFQQVIELPATLTPNTTYFVKSAATGLMDIHVSNSEGTGTLHVINRDEINTMVNTAVTGSTAIKAVANITARDATTLSTNGFVMVKDATGDSTVNAGAALYFYDADLTLTAQQTNANRFSKIAEYESLDLQITWEALQNKPTSSVTDIDDAVTKRHSHANLTQLNLITERADGELLYNGKLTVARAVELAGATW
jgi:hypothetical protein